MPVVTIPVYQTTIVDGVATGNSVLVEIMIDDVNDDGAISREEWQSYLNAIEGENNPYGHLGGTAPGIGAALWDGDGTGNFTSGTLYSSTPIDEGDSAATILATLIHNKYSVSIDELAVCFLSGTLIATPDGEKPVEDLRPGDLVLTRDHGAQPLMWVGHSRVDANRLDQNPDLRPIQIEAGALDGKLPRRPLSVSPQHRMLVNRDDGTEYLAAVRHLQVAGAKGFGIVKDDQPFTLVHIACADHEVIEAEGAATESFFTGPMAIKALRPREKLALFAAFPALADGQNPMTPARPFLKRKEVAGLLGDAMVHA